MSLTEADPQEFPPEVRRAAELALERKADDVVVLDLRGISSATDYFVIASGRSDVQVKAIADHVVDELKKDKVRPEHAEGLRGARWVTVRYPLPMGSGRRSRPSGWPASMPANRRCRFWA